VTAPAAVRRFAGAPAARQAVTPPIPGGGGRRPHERSEPPISRPEVGAGLRRRAAALPRVGPLGAVLATAVVAHGAMAPHLAVNGAAPEALLVTVAAVAIGRGPRAGAAFGFSAGLAADLFLAPPLGTAALAYTIVGHVLGGWSRPLSAGTASALCRPHSPCFACLTGGTPHRRRSGIRRAWWRRTLVLTAGAVAAGRLATAAVAATLAGQPFPRGAGLLRIAAVAAVSAPLGPPVFAAVRRIPGAAGGGGRR
jgi:hypothetical protein